MPTPTAQQKLQTEVHSKRQPPAADEIRRKQKAQAEEQHAAAQAKLPAITAPTAPTAITADNRAAVEAILDTHAPSMMPIVNFDGKEGVFRRHGTDEVIDPDTRFVAHGNGTWTGWVKFNGAGEQPTRAGGLLYGTGFKVPERDTLSDTDEGDWPISDLSGRPEDPWKLQFMLPIENIETAELVAFATMSSTGRVAIGRFLRSYNRMVSTHPTELPIIQLRPSSYVHKKFGRVHIPSLVIVGRAKTDGSQAPIAGNGPIPLTVAEDMDDVIPF